MLRFAYLPDVILGVDCGQFWVSIFWKANGGICVFVVVMLDRTLT